MSKTLLFLDNSLYVEFQCQKTQVCSVLKCNENGNIHLEILMLPLLDVLRLAQGDICKSIVCSPTTQ